MTERSNPRCGPDPRTVVVATDITLSTDAPTWEATRLPSPDILGTALQLDVGPITEVEVVAIHQAPDRSMVLMDREAFVVQALDTGEQAPWIVEASVQPKQ